MVTRSDAPNHDERSDARTILKQTGVEVHAGQFAVVSVSREEWSRILKNNALSPRGDAPFMIFSEVSEVTLVVDATGFDAISPALADSRIERGFRLLTFTAAMDFSVVGFLAEVSRVLAQAGIPIIALSSFSRDHLLVKQDDLADALKALGPHVDNLC